MVLKISSVNLISAFGVKIVSLLLLFKVIFLATEQTYNTVFGILGRLW